MDILRKIRRSTACAVACVELLYGYQESEEIVEGTSIFRNGVGLDKLDAKFLHDKDVSKLSKYDAVRIAAKYTDTQLVPAVQRKELVLSRYEDDADCDRQTRSCSYLANLLAVADDNDFSIVRRGHATDKDEREEDEDEEEEEEEKEPTRLALSNFGLRADAFFAPSVQFSTRCLAIAEESRVDGVFDPTKVREKINTETRRARGTRTCRKLAQSNKRSLRQRRLRVKKNEKLLSPLTHRRHCAARSKASRIPNNIARAYQ